MKIGSLFSGYGGLDIAVEQHFDAKTVWHTEFDDAPSKVLAAHWPDIPNHHDVSTVDWTTVEPVDIITGGFPCQDVSTAGKRAGMVDGTRSNLWGAMRTAIETIRPHYAVIENVRGLLSAKAASESDRNLEHDQGPMGNTPNINLRAIGRVLGDLAEIGYDAQWHGLRAADIGAPHHRFRVFILATNTEHHGTSAGPDWRSHGTSTTPRRRTQRITTVNHRKPTRGHHVDHRPDDIRWGVYEPAIRQWEQRLGQIAPPPTEISETGRPQLSAVFVEWMMGLNPGHVTGIDGINRTKQLKMLGNGVVPQQALAALHIMTERMLD